ncbi:MAG: hypothetical protein QF464_24225, partial [Myxococcota bacterium]|nr:hypothetical protein [Myxococcota bacterium]
DPASSALQVAASGLEAPGRFADRFPLSVTGATLSTKAPVAPSDVPSTLLRVVTDFAFPSAPAASGAVTLAVGADGVDLDAECEAKPHFAGVGWHGKMRFDGVEFRGPLTADESARGGLARVTKPSLQAAMGVADGAPGHHTLRGVGTVSAPKDLSDEASAFFDTPYVAVGGDLRIGWHHAVPDADFHGYATHQGTSPLRTRGSLKLSDRGDGATLGARVEMVYTEGRDPVAVLDGTWTYFDRPGIVFGQGHARVRRRGQVEGHVDLQLDVDTPGGELLHAVTPVDFVARGPHVRL